MRKFTLPLILLGALCIVAAFALTGYNLWDDRRAGEETEAVLVELHRQLDSVERPENPPQEETQTPQSPVAIPDYVLNPAMPMPTMEVDGYLYIGILTIPALDLELPVMDTWDYTRMQTAPCRYSGSAYLHNLIVAAHNYTAHFGRLGNLQIGDEVRFTDADGNVFRYEVSLLETLGGTAVAEMESGDWDLTLFTCTLGGVSRVTVRCTLLPTAP